MQTSNFQQIFKRNDCNETAFKIKTALEKIPNPSIMLVCLRDGSTKTVVGAATLRQKSQTYCLMSSQRYTGMIHACLWVCLASVSGSMCMFVFVIHMTARRFSLPLRTKIKS